MLVHSRPRPIPETVGQLDTHSLMSPREMSTISPRLSVGLPVYNGEAFIEETLESLLSQTYADFELVISDNASTDRTETICRSYASRDTRIRYFRQSENLGAAANYNMVFEASNGRYFKWAAHDDLYAATFLQRCVEVLDEREDVVLVFSQCAEIDESGAATRIYPSLGDIDAMNRFQRFYHMIAGRHPFIPVFGVVRREALARTKLIGKYSGSDRPLIGELALLGNIYEIPELLFFYRVHPQQSWGSGKSRRAQQIWYDPDRSGRRTYPTWRLLLEHERSIWRVPMNFRQRIVLQWAMAKWVRTRWRLLRADLVG